jgi:hypothetical protein
MKKFIFGLMLYELCLFCFSLSAGLPEMPKRSMIERGLRSPGPGYSVAPLWVWNDLLTEEDIVSTLNDLYKQGTKAAIVHPRPGLITPYLSEVWFRLWSVALKTSKRLGMQLWIYDENSYPSGFAGGFVPDMMPESRGRGLALFQTNKVTRIEDYFNVFMITNESVLRINSSDKLDGSVSNAVFVCARINRSGESPWTAGKFYVDLLYRGVTEKFLEVTLEPYRQRFSSEFGKTIMGVFTDEPHIQPAGFLPWTEDLPEQFLKRNGYDLLSVLPSLRYQVGDWKRVRHDYYKLLLELFIERWTKPYASYCASNHLELTGHYWEHEWPNCILNPDNMSMYAWHQRPAIDILMNQYSETTHSQFGNVRSVKELSSVANQFNKNRTLCEAYGAGGWDMKFEDMKRIGDWLYALGVNTLDPHLSFISIRGARKRDHPLSFSYHEPWWQNYNLVANYFARLSFVLSQGTQINDILIVEPTTTAWMYQADPEVAGVLSDLGNSFVNLLNALEYAQVEYDLGSEYLMSKFGAVNNGKFEISNRAYSIVILPEHTENLEGSTLKLLERFLSQGGKLIVLGELPLRIDGQLNDRAKDLQTYAGLRKIKSSDLLQLLRAESAQDFTIIRTDGDGGKLFHNRRQFKDGEFLFLVNISQSFKSSGTIYSKKARGAKLIDIESGTYREIPFSINSDGSLMINFELPAGGSCVYQLSYENMKAGSLKSNIIVSTQKVERPKIRLIQPNVLVLDYVDFKSKNKSYKDIYFYKANQLAFSENGMNRNPWDNAVQFKDEFLRWTFDNDSGFEVSYRFKIKGVLPQRLELVVEKPEIYTVLVNGTSVKASTNWWLDKSFRRIDISNLVKIGTNVITLVAKPMSVFHEVEPVYILGDFDLVPDDSGFVMTLVSEKRYGPWSNQGCPFYGNAVSYVTNFRIPKKSGNWYVNLGKWNGSVAEVYVNNRKVNCIWHEPYSCDITKYLKPGDNLVEVRVIGTLKNTLGPHHVDAALGAAWPGMFQSAPEHQPPGVQYNFVEYGLFEPFSIVNTQ